MNLNCEKLCFSIQPLEFMDELDDAEDHHQYMIYGYVDVTLAVQIGFKPFLFNMTESLYTRLGKLMVEITNEFIKNFKMVKS